MAHIGTFTPSEDGFNGTLHTLNLNLELNLVKNGAGDKKPKNAPDYHLRTTSGIEVGAAWRKMSKAGPDNDDSEPAKPRRAYLSVFFDDPSLPGPIYARLIEGTDGTHALYWTRAD